MKTKKAADESSVTYFVSQKGLYLSAIIMCIAKTPFLRLNWRFNGCGGRDRTCDFERMRLASYHYSTPQYSVVCAPYGSYYTVFRAHCH